MSATANPDPTGAALDALAAWFSQKVPDLTARRGWPGDNRAADPAGALLTVTPAGAGDVEACAPRSLGTLPDGQRLYRIAELLLPAQLDLWAPYPAVRDRFAREIEARLHNGLPLRSGLWLTSGFYDRPLTVTARRAGHRDDEAAGPGIGLWRAVWEVEIRTDLVVPAATPTLATATLRLTPELVGVALPEPDRDVS